MATADAGVQEQAFFDALRAGDAGAWSRLVDRYAAVVHAAVLRTGLSGEDADEAQQATWILLHRHLGCIRSPGALPSWIVTTAVREAWKLKRSQERRREHEDRAADGPDAEPPRPDELVERLERVAVVRDGLAELNERCRELLLALPGSGSDESYADVAARLSMPVGSVGPTRMRCLARLAELLKARLK
ncbi:MAG: sigma-70 family RNA polymerase sigma factor [Planctomycetota bacterium]